MSDPESLRPSKTRQELTEEAADKFARLALGLRDRGHDPQGVAHFLDQLLFCLFAEDAGLTPKGLIERLTQVTSRDPVTFNAQLAEIVRHMSTKGGGWFGLERIEWFDGNLFDGSDVIPLEAPEIEVLREVAKLDWAEVEPAIFGTLFERGLDPDRRTQLGAHYTDRASIERLVEPVLKAPLRRELEAMRADITALIGAGRPVMGMAPAERKKVDARFGAFLERVRSIVVLDPACGSGNFLYICLQALKDLEREALLWGSLTMRLPMQLPRVGPHQLRGIEINPYAAELTRVTIWIGEIQWMLRNGFGYARDPILKPLTNIETRDALIDWSDAEHPREADWPDADVIIGNPPFLGGKLLRSGLGSEYVDLMFRLYDGRVPREADFVTYWHEKARAMVDADRVRRVGLLATQGIRGGANRRVIERIKATGELFLAWSDEAWVLNGAAVHISFLGYDDGSERVKMLDGHEVTRINSNLTAGIDLTLARRLSENAGIAFMGDTMGGAFDISEEQAMGMLAAKNPDGRSNTDVVRPRINGLATKGGASRTWVVDFGVAMPQKEAALYEAPFEHILRVVKPKREGNRRAAYRERWWIHVEARPAMRAALAGLPRFVVTVIHSKHRLFWWTQAPTLPDHALIVFARDDDYTFGVLHSRVHDLWARGMGTQVREVESGFRYTPTTTFETFAFPSPTDAQREVIAAVAERLDGLRRGWLGPHGIPDEEVENRTLTNLYNERPTWLRDIHARLDEAVLDAYGWPKDITDDDLLERLLALNLERAALATAASTGFAAS